MKYRFLKSHKDSPIGSAASALTGEPWPVIRVGQLAPSALIQTPLPSTFSSMIPLEECIKEAAEEILSKHKIIYVLWSGGLDSTTTIASLMKYKTPEHRIIASTTTQVKKDAGNDLLNHLIEMGVEVEAINHKKILTYIDEGALIVSGTQADLVFMSDEWMMKHTDKYSLEYLRGLDAVESLMIRNNISRQDAEHCILCLEPLIKLMPENIKKTGHNIHWWVSFISLWDYDNYEMAFALKIPVEKTKCFFESDNFQRWALQDSSLKMIEGNPFSKARLLNICNEYLGKEFSYIKNTTTAKGKCLISKGLEDLCKSLLYIDENLNYRMINV